MPERIYNYERFDAHVERGDDAVEFGGFAGHLRAGDDAPDFAVTRLADGERLAMSDLWRRRDVVLEFGSFT